MAGLVDITTRKVLEAHLEQMATTDSLTGLANRARFFAVAESEIRRASRNKRQPTLLMIDLDNFKAINDQHGHEAGDMALKAFADLAVGMVREHDTVARLDPLPSLRLTVSIGVARIEPGEAARDSAASRADRALYKAKRSGRNRVSAADRRLDIDGGARQA